MAIDRNKLFSKAKKIIKQDVDVVFIEDLILALGISKETYYRIFQIGSDESNVLKDLLMDNRVCIKKKLRKKWKDSDNATLNAMLYKLIANDEERNLLADRVKNENQNTNINFNTENKTEFEELMSYLNNWNGFKKE